MIVFAYYLLKVFICSSILFLYYKVALQNKAFHQWNRFYLLIITLVSLVIPILEFSIERYMEATPKNSIQLVQVVTSADEYMDELILESGKATLSLEQWSGITYGLLCVILALVFIRSLLKILKIIRSHVIQVRGKIKFIETDVPGTPFSFLKYVFWNPAIDPQSETGCQILSHEIVHVQQKHTLDKLFMQCVLIFFWCNPVFWLIRKELGMVHEFIADKESVGSSGTTALAAMILHTAYPGSYHHLTNPFFKSSIKRRLSMLTKHHNPGFRYVARIMSLLVLVIVSLAFSLKTKDVVVNSIHSKEPITVIIDAGHGYRNGTQPDGAGVDGIYEDDLALEIAKRIKEANFNKDIRILLTREDKNIVDLSKRVKLAAENGADLFISLHVAALPPPADLSKVKRSGGMEVYVSERNPATQQRSELLGSAVIEQLKNVYDTYPVLLKRKYAGIYVLDKNSCPAVMIDCGFMSNKKDLEFIRNGANQEVVAQAILKAIERYAVQMNTPRTIVKSSPDTLNNNKATAKGHESLEHAFTNSKQGSKESSVTNTKVVDTVPRKKQVYERVEQPAQFYTGKDGWAQYLARNINHTIGIDNGAPAGTYTVKVQFIVHDDGNISDLTALTKYGYGMEEEVIRLLKLSPKWKPAVHNGRKVNTYHTQPVTFVIAEEVSEPDPKP
jgi:N-acetylmuramoyl-L-alanine amidase